MSPITSPDDHSPVKPALFIETKQMDYDWDTNIDDIEDLSSEAVTLFQDINEDCVIDPLYKPDFMEMDGTYVHNTENSLTFTYGAEPERYAMSVNITEKVLQLLSMHLIVSRTCLRHVWLLAVSQRIDFSIDVSFKWICLC